MHLDLHPPFARALGLKNANCCRSSTATNGVSRRLLVGGGLLAGGAATTAGVARAEEDARIGEVRVF